MLAVWCSTQHADHWPSYALWPSHESLPDARLIAWKQLCGPSTAVLVCCLRAHIESHHVRHASRNSSSLSSAAWDNLGDLFAPFRPDGTPFRGDSRQGQATCKSCQWTGYGQRRRGVQSDEERQREWVHHHRWHLPDQCKSQTCKACQCQHHKRQTPWSPTSPVFWVGIVWIQPCLYAWSCVHRQTGTAPERKETGISHTRCHRGISPSEDDHLGLPAHDQQSSGMSTEPWTVFGSESSSARNFRWTMTRWTSNHPCQATWDRLETATERGSCTFHPWSLGSTDRWRSHRLA